MCVCHSLFWLVLLQMVARLKQQVQELREELSMATGEERTDELTSEEKEGWEVVC